MTDDWLDETKKIFDLKEQRQRMKHAADTVKREGRKVARFRSSGINWKVIALLALVVTVIISFVAINSVVRNIMIMIGIICVFLLIVNAVRGKVKFGIRGWLTIGIITLVGIAFLGTGIRMSLSLSLSDVKPKITGWRFNTETDQYYCDKSLDGFSYYITSIDAVLLEPGNTIYSRTLIPVSCPESTSQSWVMDMDGTRTGMPDIDFSLEGMYPSDADGTTIDDFEFEDYPINDNITLVQTFVKVVAVMEFTTDQPYMETEKFILEDFFTRFEGEFYLEYITKEDSPDAPKYVANTGGKRVTGEFAFGVETGKIKWTADEELPEAEFISTAVIGAELILLETSFARTSGLGGELDGVSPGDWGANGEYDVGQLGRQLLYRDAWDCLQKSDGWDSEPLSEKNYQDNFVPTVYVSVPFDVLMGGFSEYAGVSNDLTEKDEVFWISRFTSKLTFLVEIVSAYDLNIEGGVSPTSTNTDADPPDSNVLVDLWNQISGWVIDFWKTSWYGKAICIAVPVILVGTYGGVGISKNVKDKMKKSGVGRGVTQVVNVVVGEGNKLPDMVKKTTKRAGRKAKGLFKRLKSLWK